MSETPKKTNENLICLGDRTTEEQREIARQGGIASGIARRRKKTLREELLILLEQIEDGESETYNSRISVSMITQALNGNVRAFETIRDTIGEKPVDQVNIGSEQPTKINISFGDKSNRDKYKEADPVIVDGGALKSDIDGD